jgi:hypothetical protein
MLIALIITAEIAFCLILLFGLLARHGLGRPRLGMALFVATPFVDIALRGDELSPASGFIEREVS